MLVEITANIHLIEAKGENVVDQVKNNWIYVFISCETAIFLEITGYMLLFI